MKVSLDGRVLRVVLPRVLTAGAASEAERDLDAVLSPAGTAPVGMLVDTRALREGAFELVGAIEMRAGRLARVTKVARLVTSAPLAEESNRAALAAGIAGAVRAFTDEAAAVAFLETA